MRPSFFEELISAMERDDRVTLVTGDLGYGRVEPIQENHPDQFVNAGIAEQSMTGMAAGLAHSGRKVFTFSICNFPTLRCLEQIRNDVCYHEADVKIVSVGEGFGYGALGSTHHGTEDLAILRALPNMTVLAPGDPLEARMASRELMEHDGPAYMRVGRGGEPEVHSELDHFKIGEAIEVRWGEDVALLATGSMLSTATDVADALSEDGIEAAVYSFHTVKPLDEETLREVAEGFPSIWTLEEHTRSGGFGSAVAESLLDLGLQDIPRLDRVALPSRFAKTVGNQEFLRKEFGLDEESITSEILGVLSSEGLVSKSVTA